jgi:superfamily I DNA/RNA helicase
MIEQYMLTDKQRESVNFDERGDLLVKGVAGSGKSVVLMQRAVKMNATAIKKGQEKKILILTYTKALVNYTAALVDMTGLDPRMIEVKTIDSCCFDVYCSMIHGRANIVKDGNDRSKYVAIAIQKHLDTHPKHRFHDVDPEFWAEEFIWIKQKNLCTVERYRDAERAGRGGKVRMTKDDRDIAYQLYQSYCEVLEEKGLKEREDLYAYLIKNAINIPKSKRYDYVLVDEAQDLSFVKLKFAKIIARESITIAADKAQKIYSTTFSWKELGIDIKGRASKTLDKPFRSTRQIVQLAESLLEVNRAMQTDLSEFTDPVLPEREGMVPVVVNCANAAVEEDVVIKLINRAKKEHSIGLLYRSYEQKNRISEWLNTNHIQFETVDNEWKMDSTGVKLFTLHSSKGLEFDMVVIPFFGRSVLPLESNLEGADEAQKREIIAQERSLLYVGMTRAKYDLYITFSGRPSEFLNDFSHEFYRFLDPKGGELSKPTRTDIDALRIQTEMKSSPKESVLPKEMPPKRPVIESVSRYCNTNDRCLMEKACNGKKIQLKEVASGKDLSFEIDSHRTPWHKILLGKVAGEVVTIGSKQYKVVAVLKQTYGNPWY